MSLVHDTCMFLFDSDLTVHVSNRRILLFPRGNKVPTQVLSAYLDCGEPQAQPNNWSRRATFKLQLLNQLDPSKTISKGTFCALSCHATSIPSPDADASMACMQRQLIISHLRLMTGASLPLPLSMRSTSEAPDSWWMTPCRCVLWSRLTVQKTCITTAKSPRAMLASRTRGPLAT